MVNRRRLPILTRRKPGLASPEYAGGGVPSTIARGRGQAPAVSHPTSRQTRFGHAMACHYGKGVFYGGAGVIPWLRQGLQDVARFTGSQTCGPSSVSNTGDKCRGAQSEGAEETQSGSAAAAVQKRGAR